MFIFSILYMSVSQTASKFGFAIILTTAISALFFVFAFAKKDYVFLFVDGSKDIIPSSNGYYRTTTLSWLDKELKKHNNKKAIIFQHFPIIPPVNDELKSTQKPEEYLSLLEEHGNIEAIISGHFGINSEKEINGILHITTAPAPQYRVIDIIDYETNNPTFWSTIKQ